MTTYKCQCGETCPGSVRAYVDEGSEEAIRVALEIWTATISRHTIYLSRGDATALGEELKKLTSRALRPDDELPSIASLSGSDPNFTGDMTTEEYIQWGRKFAR